MPGQQQTDRPPPCFIAIEQLSFRRPFAVAPHAPMPPALKALLAQLIGFDLADERIVEIADLDDLRGIALARVQGLGRRGRNGAATGGDLRKQVVLTHQGNTQKEEERTPLQLRDDGMIGPSHFALFFAYFAYIDIVILVKRLNLELYNKIIPYISINNNYAFEKISRNIENVICMALLLV